MPPRSYDYQVTLPVRDSRMLDLCMKQHRMTRKALVIIAITNPELYRTLLDAIPDDMMTRAMSDARLTPDDTTGLPQEPLYADAAVYAGAPPALLQLEPPTTPRYIRDLKAKRAALIAKGIAARNATPEEEAEVLRLAQLIISKGYDLR